MKEEREKVVCENRIFQIIYLAICYIILLVFLNFVLKEEFAKYA